MEESGSGGEDEDSDEKEKTDKEEVEVGAAEYDDQVPANEGQNSKLPESTERNQVTLETIKKEVATPEGEITQEEGENAEVCAMNNSSGAATDNNADGTYGKLLGKRKTFSFFKRKSLRQKNAHSRDESSLEKLPQSVEETGNQAGLPDKNSQDENQKHPEGNRKEMSPTNQGSGYSPLEDDEDVYAHNRYKDTPWCSPIKVKYGYASCRSPHGGYYRNVLGTKCDIRCQKGYELHGPQQLICQSNKRWSGKVLCKQKRCPTLSMPPNGGFKCSDGAYYNSRCDYYCSPGYQLKGDRIVQCLDNKLWSGKPASCVDAEPPRIQCPRVKEKTAEPNKLTARVFWDTPEGRDTADGILTDVILKGLPPGSHFSEGDHKIQYTVFDRAENKGSCKFLIKVKVRRCGKLNAPENGYIKCSGDGDNYGATCEFSCIGGYDLQGSPARVCQFNLGWSGAEPSCTPMSINVGVRTAAALLDQFYEKRRLLIISTPTAANFFYRLQLGMLQPAQCGLALRHITVIELVGIFPSQLGRIGLKLMPPALALQLRLLLRIPHYNFNMVVVDKHGVDKERYPFPATPAELFTLIDSFPLRKDEMKLQAEAAQSCP